ncbi:putative spore wall protein 12 [Nosema bombycis CQ1]|uniref:Putative spore wall protein 12 n=1 Tax=Nosema bombycis (strain CQ1 / CVCC 102059) TaxID=578461 RepID=R0MIS7_NOSB1|nr:putative spore wall protein 12 [Nosema bombycis CQ1]|eukprot:EOB12703.1 putative spore wall protein 12 [Nosema bombycis CQ1]
MKIFAKAKEKFNEQCGREMEVLMSMKKRAETTDEERENAKIYRYDLEKAKQSNNPEDQEEVDRLSELFENSQTRTIEMMRDFYWCGWITRRVDSSTGFEY